MTGKRLTDREKNRIENLTAAGVTPHRVAGQLARSPHTVSKYIANPVTQEIIAGKLETIALGCLDSVCAEDLQKANLVGKITAAAIAIDKYRLIRGQASQIDIRVLLDAVDAIKAMRRGGTRELPAGEPEG